MLMTALPDHFSLDKPRLRSAFLPKLLFTEVNLVKKNRPLCGKSWGDFGLKHRSFLSQWGYIPLTEYH
jgi:hypothetical protein